MKRVWNRIGDGAIRRAAITLVLAIGLITLGSAMYMEIGYSRTMPHSPQPAHGRIYPVSLKGQATVYVTKEELDRKEFIEYRMVPLFGLVMLLTFGLGSWLGWWAKSPNQMN